MSSRRILIFYSLLYLLRFHTSSALVTKFPLGYHDAKSVGHHDVIEAGVRTVVIDRCPTDRRDDSEHSVGNLTFNLVCNRKIKSNVIGSCHWQLPSETQDGDARFEEKQQLINQMPRNESAKCGCGIEYGFLTDDFSCNGLQIEGPRSHIIILATSPTRRVVNAGSPVHFWIDYIISESESNKTTDDGHSLFITHWYNSIFSKRSWHLLHSFYEPAQLRGRTPDEEGSGGGGLGKPMYRAHMRIEKATVDESGIYSFEINHDHLAASLAFSLNVRSEETLLHFYVRTPQPSDGHHHPSYDPFERVNPRFLEARKEYEIVCGATIGDDEPRNRSHTLALYRTPCEKDPSSGIVVCKSDPDSLPTLVALDRDAIQISDPANGRNYSRSAEGRHILIVYRVTAVEPSVYDCIITNPDDGTNDTADSIRFIPTDILSSVKNRGIEVIARSATGDRSDQSQPTFYDQERIVFECRYQATDYRFERWQFVGDFGYTKPITHNTTRHNLEYERGPWPYSAAVARLTILQANADMDPGTYICSVTDRSADGGSPRSINTEKRISVVHPMVPRFEASETLSTVSLEVNETESLELNCMIQPDVSPWPVIVWFKDGEPLEGPINYASHMQRIHFRRVVSKDSGNYSCRATNRAGTIERFFSVNVLTDGSLLNGIAMAGDNERTQKSLIAVLCVLSVFMAVLLTILGVLAVKSYRKKKRLIELHRQRKENAACLDPNVPINQQPENLPYDSHYETTMDRLALGPIIGEGQFGKVLDGYVMSGGDNDRSSVHVAVKVPKDGMNIQHQKMLLSEFKIMAYVGNHVNVLGLVAAVTHRMPKGELYICTEYCELGSLRTYLLRHRSSFHNDLATCIEKNGYILSNDFVRRSRSNAGLSLNVTDGGGPLVNPTNASTGSQLRTTDLLSFAYQVANGMDYLASRNVVHRDLALRNILLTKDNLVKIGDFGLALHKDRETKGLKSNVPLPAKWMALESILYGEYSAKSDVWSFGIVLWEIFTLADPPYPGRAPSAELGDWLAEGNRLPPPKYAPEEIYRLMTQCWREHPHERPTFVECREQIGIDLHLRSQQAFESLESLLNNFHAYVNVQGSLVSDESSPLTGESSFSKSIFEQLGVSDGFSGGGSRPLESPGEAENLLYSLSEPTSTTIVAVENLDYDRNVTKAVEWV